MKLKLLRPEVRENCENLVQAVIKIKFSNLSIDLRMANTSLYIAVHFSYNGVFQERCNGESYSSMRMTTCCPVCFKQSLLFQTDE